MATETDAAYDMQAKRLLGHKEQIIINVEAQKDDEMREELSEMCNLSQGVKEWKVGDSQCEFPLRTHLARSCTGRSHRLFREKALKRMIKESLRIKGND